MRRVSCQGIAGAREQGVSAHDLGHPKFATAKVQEDRKMARWKTKKCFLVRQRAQLSQHPARAQGLAQPTPLHNPSLKPLLGVFLALPPTAWDVGSVFELGQRGHQLPIGRNLKGCMGPAVLPLEEFCRAILLAVRAGRSCGRAPYP